MRRVYERERRLRESASRTIHEGEQRPPKPSTLNMETNRWTYYTETRTAAELRRVFEKEDVPWWSPSSSPRRGDYDPSTAPIPF